MGKAKGNKPQYTPRKKKPELTEEELKELQLKHGKFAKHSTIIVIFTSIVLVLLFAGRWVFAITDGYYGSFILREWWEVDDAMANSFGLDLTSAEQEVILPDQESWDVFRSSRLRDEVTITASYDEVPLHGYYYSQDSDTTVVVLHQFDENGEADFTAGGWLGGELGYNILLPDARNHGESGGEYFSWGYLEQYDLADWLNWASEKWPNTRFILWGRGFGANTALFAESNHLLPDAQIRGIVAESSYASFHELAAHHIYSWYTIPAFPTLNALELKLKLSKTGFVADDMELAPVMASGNANVPVLFIQSTDDTYILSEWSLEAFSLYRGQKDAVTSSGSHRMIYTCEKAKIQNVINNWS